MCVDGKVRVEFSEPVRASGQSLPSVSSGGVLLDCKGSLDEIGASVWLTCPDLRESAVVGLPVGAMVGLADGQPVLDVAGQPFERAMNFAELRSDGQCYYFVP